MKRLARKLVQSLARRRLWLALLPLTALAQGGCSTYSYFDVDLKLGDGFTTVEQTGKITNCHMSVTGATSDDFEVSADACLNATKLASTKDMGKIRYSTFADSGAVTFTLRLFTHQNPIDACELGRGSVSLTISSGNTVPGVLTVPLMGGQNCPQ